tara:strand:+ start:91 stop:513 length:423 start_codon:yes stop_codon:yes gene_type:complete
MAYVIKPVLTVTANAASASTEAGPASIALALSARPDSNTSTVTGLETFIYQTTAATVKVWDHANAPVFLYLKNQATTDTNNDIYIGIAATDLSANQDARVMTLKYGEFAYMPWAGEHDLYVEAENGTGLPKLEVWIFTTT